MSDDKSVIADVAQLFWHQFSRAINNEVRSIKATSFKLQPLSSLAAGRKSCLSGIRFLSPSAASSPDKQSSEPLEVESSPRRRRAFFPSAATYKLNEHSPANVDILGRRLTSNWTSVPGSSCSCWSIEPSLKEESSPPEFCRTQIRPPEVPLLWNWGKGIGQRICNIAFQNSSSE